MLLQNSASNVQWRIQIQNCFGPFSPAGLGFGRKNKVGTDPRAPSLDPPLMFTALRDITIMNTKKSLWER